jgi:hypothetical protein
MENRSIRNRGVGGGNLPGMSGSEIFWSSGTWWLIFGQFLFLILVLMIYFYQGRQERKAEDRRDMVYEEGSGQG